MTTQKPDSELTAANATHELICQHVCRWTKTYAMRCHVLKTMPDGRLKLKVFGDRNWKNRDHISRIRYVEADRVRLRRQQTSEQGAHNGQSA